jgi:hypothetical protein
MNDQVVAASLFVEDFCAIHECPTKTLSNIQRCFHKYFAAMDSNKKQKSYLNTNLELESYKFCIPTLVSHPLLKLFAIIQPMF